MSVTNPFKRLSQLAALADRAAEAKAAKAEAQGIYNAAVGLPPPEKGGDAAGVLTQKGIEDAWSKAIMAEYKRALTMRGVAGGAAGLGTPVHGPGPSPGGVAVGWRTPITLKEETPAERLERLCQEDPLLRVAITELANHVTKLEQENKELTKRATSAEELAEQFQEAHEQAANNHDNACDQIRDLEHELKRVRSVAEEALDLCDKVSLDSPTSSLRRALR